MPGIFGTDDPILAKYRERFDGTGNGEPLSFQESAEIFESYQKQVKRLIRIARISDNYQGEVKTLVMELQDALTNVKTLNGCLPICASCKKIRSDDGYWNQLEQYISDHSETLFSHGLCPECTSNYRALSHLPQKGLTQPLPNPAHMLDETDFDDPVILKFLPVFTNPHYAISPLYADFNLLFQKYVRLSKRMKRIVRISDSYQSQLHGLKTELEQASRTDYLTGLPNRRDMYNRLAMEQSRSLRHGSTFAVVMIDFDDFKSINDRYGHDIGDKVLVASARIMEKNVRKEDSIARWGGEEFLALFPETCQESALTAAKKLRKVISEAAVTSKGARIRPTVSIGIALYKPGETVAACIKHADEALLQAKRDGRNRSVLYAEE